MVRSVWAATRGVICGAVKLSTTWLSIALIGLLVVVAVLFTVADELANRCMPWETPVAAHLSIDTAHEVDGRVEVTGAADLPNGALLYYCFYHGGEADFADLPEYEVAGEARVGDGRFTFADDLSGWPEGRAQLDVWFQVGQDSPQPAEVRKIFGTNGQCMTGPQVGVDSPGDPKVMLTRARVPMSGSDR